MTEIVAWRMRHDRGRDHWIYTDHKPEGTSVHLFEVQALARVIDPDSMAHDDEKTIFAMHDMIDQLHGENIGLKKRIESLEALREGKQP